MLKIIILAFGMVNKFQNKYRIPSARLQTWDYGSNTAYFITICTQARISWFGKIEEQTMKKSEIGNFASQCWFEIPRHFPFVVLGAFVVMPNHVHGIVIINKNDLVGDGDSVRIVETQNFASLQSTQQQNWQPNQFGPQSQNLASIIRGYKIGVTKLAHTIESAFQWQPRYHDHIIRNANEYKRIENYIINNPSNWNKDKFYK